VVDVVEDQAAVSERHAAALSGFSVRPLRAWDARGLVGPSIKRQLSERNTVRVYAFDDLVELLVASALVDAGPSAASDPAGGRASAGPRLQGAVA
jgi:hypothetical protein